MGHSEMNAKDKSQSLNSGCMKYIRPQLNTLITQFDDDDDDDDDVLVSLPILLLHYHHHHHHHHHFYSALHVSSCLTPGYILYFLFGIATDEKEPVIN
jgi:hypothetical protein